MPRSIQRPNSENFAKLVLRVVPDADCVYGHGRVTGCAIVVGRCDIEQRVNGCFETVHAHHASPRGGADHGLNPFESVLGPLDVDKEYASRDWEKDPVPVADVRTSTLDRTGTRSQPLTSPATDAGKTRLYYSSLRRFATRRSARSKSFGGVSSTAYAIATNTPREGRRRPDSSRETTVRSIPAMSANCSWLTFFCPRACLSISGRTSSNSSSLDRPIRRLLSEC
jgi:hypothetical protein